MYVNYYNYIHIYIFYVQINVIQRHVYISGICSAVQLRPLLAIFVFISWDSLLLT